MAPHSFVPDSEAAVAVEPGDRPFDLPAVPAEPLAGLDTWTGYARDKVPATEPAEMLRRVVRLVRADLHRPPSTWSAPGADGGDAENQRFEHLAIVHVRAGHRDGQREALNLGQHVQIAASLAAIDRFGRLSKPPIARTDAASTIVGDQSSSPLAPSSSSTTRCSRRPNPALVHTVNRRCAVAGETSKESGRYRHAQPLVSAYTTAVNTARSSAGAVPPSCGRFVNFGNNGAVSSYRSSGTQPTQQISTQVQHQAASTKRHVRHPLNLHPRRNSGMFMAKKSVTSSSPATSDSPDTLPVQDEGLRQALAQQRAHTAKSVRHAGPKVPHCSRRIEDTGAFDLITQDLLGGTTRALGEEHHWIHWYGGTGGRGPRTAPAAPDAVCEKMTWQV